MVAVASQPTWCASVRRKLRCAILVFVGTMMHCVGFMARQRVFSFLPL